MNQSVTAEKGSEAPTACSMSTEVNGSDVRAEHQRPQLPNQTILKEKRGWEGFISTHTNTHTLACLRICIKNVRFNVAALERAMCV